MSDFPDSSHLNHPSNAGVTATIIEIAGRRYIRPEALAKLLQVSERTISRWDARRAGPPRISLGKLVLYDLGKIPRWLESRESTPLRTGGSRR